MSNTHLFLRGPFDPSDFMDSDSESEDGLEHVFYANEKGHTIPETNKEIKKDQTYKPKRSKPSLARFKYIGTYQKWKCRICLNMLDVGCQIDHIVPWNHSHDDSDENLQILCGSCHNKKSFNEEYRKHYKAHSEIFAIWNHKQLISGSYMFQIELHDDRTNRIWIPEKKLKKTMIYKVYKETFMK